MFSIDILFLVLLTRLAGFQSGETGFWGRPFRALADFLRERHTLGHSWGRAEVRAELEGVDGGLWGRQQAPPSEDN